MNKFLIILRGIPGSGKSTVAQLLSENGKYPVCTADDFFMKDGVYQFDMTKLGIAHKVCKEKALQSMKDGHEKVFIANTNVKESEINPYIKMAEENGYSVISLIVENRHGNINIHSVPQEVLETMKSNFTIKL